MWASEAGEIGAEMDAEAAVDAEAAGEAAEARAEVVDEEVEVDAEAAGVEAKAEVDADEGEAAEVEGAGAAEARAEEAEGEAGTEAEARGVADEVEARDESGEAVRAREEPLQGRVRNAEDAVRSNPICGDDAGRTKANNPPGQLCSFFFLSSFRFRASLSSTLVFASANGSGPKGNLWSSSRLAQNCISREVSSLS